MPYKKVPEGFLGRGFKVDEKKQHPDCGHAEGFDVPGLENVQFNPEGLEKVPSSKGELTIEEKAARYDALCR